jgi:flagellar biosynthesis anti-sigma factor FlgM
MRPPEPAPRKRVGVDSAASGKATGTPSASQADASVSADKVSLLSSDPASVRRYVDALKSMDPIDLHKVEDLRQRIASGAYRADPEELAGRLADVLERSGRGDGGSGSDA